MHSTGEAAHPVVLSRQPHRALASLWHLAHSGRPQQHKLTWGLCTLCCIGAAARLSGTGRPSFCAAGQGLLGRTGSGSQALCSPQQATSRDSAGGFCQAPFTSSMLARLRHPYGERQQNLLQGRKSKKVNHKRSCRPLSYLHGSTQGWPPDVQAVTNGERAPPAAACQACSHAPGKVSVQI